MTLHAEQQAAIRRVQDLERREVEAEDRLRRASHALSRYDAEEVLDDDDVYAVILEKDFAPSIDDVVEHADVDISGLDSDVLSDLLAEISTDVRQAVEELVVLVPSGADHEDWPDFRRRHKMEIGRRDVWSWVYQKIVDARKQDARRAERQRRESSPYGNLMPFYDTASVLQGIPLVSPEASGLRRVVASQHEIAERGSLQRDIESARLELRGLEQERRLAEETRDATRQPEGFQLALQVLTLLAVVGLAFPLLVMGAGVTSLPPAFRWAVIVAFIIGLAALLRFLFVYASFLRDGGRPALPRSILHLLK